VAFESEIDDDALSPLFLAAVREGVMSSTHSGVLGSYPMLDVKITLTGVEARDDESSEIAFESAASMALQAACEKAGPVLLEPIMKVEVVTPEEYFGAINSDLSMRRATIMSTTIRAKSHVIDAEVPLSTMFGYATNVRSLSQGRASYSMEPARYAKMPANLAAEILGVM
jgi:elongation factor G